MTNIRRLNLKPSDFLGYKIPIPSKTVQKKLRAVRTPVNTLKRLYAESAAELDALMSSILARAFKGKL